MKHQVKVIYLLTAVFTVFVFMNTTILKGAETSYIEKIDGTRVPVSELDKAIPALLDKADIPGISLAIINNSKIVYSRVFGLKNVNTKEKVTEDTLFEAASLTKPVLAYTAMKLVDEGKLELDKPLYQYMEYKDISHDERYKLITARIVLKHSSGFPNWRWMNKDKKLDIKFTPGEKFSYSGEGYVFLQRVIEKITGKDLEAIVKEKVFIPLKMDKSSLILKDTKRCAIGHSQDLEPRKKRLSKRPNGAASLHTTAGDYAAFLIAVSNGRGLSEKSFNEMLRPQISISEDDSTLSWGLGFALQKTEDDTYLWHWGDNGVFKAYGIISKRKKTGMIYFANSFNGLSIMDKMVDITIGGKYSISSQLKYPQYDSPVPVIQKLIANKGLETGLKKYKEWKEKEPKKFNERTLNSIGYYLLGEKKIKDAIEIFKLNVKAYPDSFNVYDSLGEAYMKAGNKELAIKNYEKSVRLNQDNRGGIEALKKLKSH